MEHSRVSIKYKLSKSTESNKSRFGEEAMIFLLLNWKKVMKDTQHTISDTKILIQRIFPRQRYTLSFSEFEDHYR
jgi:hypothetical protein